MSFWELFLSSNLALVQILLNSTQKTYVESLSVTLGNFMGKIFVSWYWIFS